MKSIMIHCAILFGAFFLFSACNKEENKIVDDEPVDTDTVEVDNATGEDALLSDADEAATDIDPRFDAFIAALKQDLANSNAYGISAAVMEKGAVTFAAAFGSKDAEGKIPLTFDSLMQIGSITKQMTATALLRKVEEDKFSLDDTLEDLLPELEFSLDATWDDQITIHHLLTHQGGFYDYLPWNGDSGDSELKEYTYNGFDDQYFLMVPPGLFFNYSNPNFVFAGLLTETYDTRLWPDIMAEDIFLPLGMDRTFLRKSAVEADGDYAGSYGMGIDDLQKMEQGDVTMEMMPDPGWGRPAGLVWTTPTQLMTWAKFLIDGDKDILSDQMRAKITTPQVDTLYGPTPLRYGYGMMLQEGFWTQADQYYEMPVWQHSGATLSFSSMLLILPDQEFAVAIILSSYGADFTHSLDVAVTTLAELPEPAAETPVYVIDPAKFDDHVGTYFDPYYYGHFIVTREGDSLRVEAPEMEGYGYTVDPELTPLSSDIFYMKILGVPGDITFIREGAEGPSKYLRHRSFVGVRVEEEVPRMLPKPSRETVDRAMQRMLLTPREMPPVNLPRR